MSSLHTYWEEQRAAKTREHKELRHVYFIRQVGVIGPVKIGASIYPRVRLEGLQVWSPVRLEIAAAIKGDFNLERRFHNAFLASHSHGEWFHATPDIEDTILQINAGTFDINTLPTKTRPLHGQGGIFSPPKQKPAQVPASPSPPLASV